MVASITQYICKGSNYSMYRGGTLYSGDWYRGVHDGDWGELSFSPSPQLEESVEPIRPHTRASEVEGIIVIVPSIIVLSLTSDAIGVVSRTNQWNLALVNVYTKGGTIRSSSSMQIVHAGL